MILYGIIVRHFSHGNVAFQNLKPETWASIKEQFPEQVKAWEESKSYSFNQLVPYLEGNYNVKVLN